MAPSAPHRMDRIVLCEFSLDRIYRMNRIWRKRRILSSGQNSSFLRPLRSPRRNASRLSALAREDEIQLVPRK